MKTKTTTNHVIDWEGSSEEAIAARKHYLLMLRGLLSDLDDLLGWPGDEVCAIFAKWNVYFIDIDDFPRINLDDPPKEAA